MLDLNPARVLAEYQMGVASLGNPACAAMNVQGFGAGVGRVGRTGGNNYNEAKGVVAHNVVHHSKQYPSQVSVTVVRR